MNLILPIYSFMLLTLLLPTFAVEFKLNVI